jgi:hydrogenase maturation protease
MPNRNRLAILGVGNVLCTDDGLGPRVVERLSRDFAAPEGVAVLDGGTLGLSLLPIIEDSDQVLIVDAIRMDAPAGALVFLEGDEVLPAVRLRLSVHQVGMADLLDAARMRGRLPRTLLLLGLVPESIELGYELSAAVSEALPRLVEAIVEKVRELGFELTPLCTPHSVGRQALSIRCGLN